MNYLNQDQIVGVFGGFCNCLCIGMKGSPIKRTIDNNINLYIPCRNYCTDECCYTGMAVVVQYIVEVWGNIDHEIPDNIDVSVPIDC